MPKPLCSALVFYNYPIIRDCNNHVYKKGSFCLYHTKKIYKINYQMVMSELRLLYYPFTSTQRIGEEEENGEEYILL